MQTWTRSFKSLLKLFLQSNCALCQRPTSSELCPDCTRQLQKCHLQSPGSLWKPPLPVLAWGKYGGILKRAIAAMKYDNHPEIARPLGQYLAEVWLLHAPKCKSQLTVVPIPMHPSKLKTRGYNQAALIAQSFCEVTGLKLKPHGLERVKQTQAQFGLSPSERGKNLTAAFALGEDFRRRPHTAVLLLDDIYTTGATAKSAIQTLHQAGISVYGLATVAAAGKDR
ncbi:MAG: ComF family protein [Nostocaceae cyanobacterium]|nr:ComF family protein [Nostocaceae cyanobacterium]